MPGLLRPLMVPVMRLRAASESQAEVVVEVGERERRARPLISLLGHSSPEELPQSC